MAKADCAICEASGYLSCDRCGNPVFPDQQQKSAFGEDLCAYCKEA